MQRRRRAGDQSLMRRGGRDRRLYGWGRALLWGSCGLVGLLGVAYLALGVTVLVSCGCPPGFQEDAARMPTHGQALPALRALRHAPAAAWPLIIGHSGSAYWCRRNTLECLAQSLALGATMLEVDVRLSADGALVAFHDADVDDHTDGTGTVRALTREQLLALHVRRAVMPPEVEADEPQRLQGQRIAVLDEVRQAFPQTPLLLDIKSHTPPMDAALVAFVQRFEAPDFTRIFIKTRNQRLANRLRRLPQPPRTGLTLCERIAFVAYPGLVTAPPGLLDLPLWLVSPALLHRATAAGHLVVVSLVNDAQDWHQALALPGLFGIVTDRPEVAVHPPHPAPPTSTRRGAPEEAGREGTDGP